MSGMCFEGSNTQTTLTNCHKLYEWPAEDYNSNDNSTYGGWINLPGHTDHKSNLTIIILLPDEELMPNVVQWSEGEDVFVVVGC